MTEKKGLDLAKKRTDEFHTAFGHKVSEKPTELTREEAINRVRFIVEELVELLAVYADDYIDLVNLVDNNIMGAAVDAEEKEIDAGLGDRDKLVDVADALTDINVFVQGTFSMLGVEPQPLYDIVMDANMAKLGPDGKPIYRESDGKIMKPEGWAENWAPEPKLRAEILKQLDK